MFPATKKEDARTVPSRTALGALESENCPAPEDAAGMLHDSYDILRVRNS